MPAAIRGRGELADAEENWSEARGAGRCRGLVRDSGEPGELADEDWSETQGSQGSWQMQRKIGQRLRGARGATWLERSASLAAGAILNSIAAIGGPC